MTGTASRTRIIACGAIARETIAVLAQSGMHHVELTCLPAILHNHPERIPGEIEREILEARAEGIEDIFVGYRYYEKKNVGVRFPFGYGLSYTTFAVDNLRLSADEYALGQPVDLLVDVTNTGAVAGHAVVQIYVHDVDAGVMRPEKELKAFAKVALEPGERKSVHLSLDQRALSFFDDARHAWVAEAGEFDVLAGLSSADIGATARFTLTVPAEVAAAMPAPVALSIRSTLRDVISQPAGRAVLDALLPGMADSPQAEMAMGMTLEAIAGFVPNILTKEKLAAIDEELRGLSG